MHPLLMSELDTLDRFTNRTDLIEFDQDAIREMVVYPHLQSLDIGHIQVITDRTDIIQSAFF